jgi:rhodanese-related sulfurtransferase
MTSLIAILFAATLSTVQSVEIKPDPVPRMTVDELRAAMAKGDAVPVDVRATVPYELGHIPGAIWAPLGLLAKKLDELPRDKTLVLYCTCAAEELSLSGAAELREHGFERVAALTGGYPAWFDAGHPVAKVQQDETPPPPPTLWVEKASEPNEPEAAARGGRLMPPGKIRCKADDVTVYNGKVIAYSRTAGRTTLTIRTDYDTTETVVVAYEKGDDPAKWFLVFGEPFTSEDWKKIEQKKGTLHPGMRANAWVCTDGKAIIDWRPGEGDAVE